MPSTIPKVSIIIPCFNYGPFLSDALGAVLQQSHDSWECIVVDDGSTDDSRLVAERFAQTDSRIRCSRIPRQGISAARNHGLRASTGSHVQFLDADDLIESDKLASQLRCFHEHPSVDIVYSPARYFTTEEPARRDYSLNAPDAPWMPEVSGPGSAVLPVLASRNILPINSPLISRRLIDRVGFFNEDLRATEDWEYWIRCAVAGANFLYSDTPHTYALVRKHERSTTATHTLLMLKDSLRVRIWAVHLVHDPTTRHTLRAIVHDKRIAMREFEVQQGRLFVSTIALATAQLRARRYRAALRSFLLLAALPLLPPTTVRALLVGQESLRRLVSTLPGAPRRNR